jgi:hypothetical protein
MSNKEEAFEEIKKKTVKEIDFTENFLIPRFGMGIIQHLVYDFVLCNEDKKLFLEKIKNKKLEELYVNSGILTDSDTDLTNFIKYSLEIYQKSILISIVAVDKFNSYKLIDNTILNYVNKKCIHHDLITNNGKDIWYRKDVFKNKKVLFISSHAETMKSQWESGNVIKGYQDKNENFPNTKFIFCEMILNTGIKDKDKLDNWKLIMEKMKNKINKIDFDIALISAGGYANLLCDYIYTDLKKSACNKGGNMQILFCIKGQRWDVRDDVSKLYNQYWIRHTPKYPELYNIENGCYW